MNAILASIHDKKAELDQRRPASQAALRQLQKHYDVELTFTSNAIEGNTLTLRETAEVIEHGITAGGKNLKDHLEAVDHYDARLGMRDIAAQTAPVDEETVRELHRRIVARSEPAIAGLYSPHRRRIAGSPGRQRPHRTPAGEFAADPVRLCANCDSARRSHDLSRCAGAGVARE